MKMQPDECFGPGRVCLMYGTDHDILYLYIRNSAPQDRGEQRPLRDGPIGPGPPARGCPYRRALLVVYAHTKDRDGRGLRASGWGRAKSRSPAQGGCGGSDPMREAGAPNTRKLKPTL